MCVRVSGPYVFLGTGNSGVWRRPLSEVSARKARNELGTTAQTAELNLGIDGIIRYRLSNESFVSIKLYDIRGRLLYTAISGALLRALPV